MKNQLPPSFRPLLWSYQFNSLDSEKDKRAIIVNTINYGNIDHWKWITHAYGKDTVKKILEALPESEIRPQARRLASVMFSAHHSTYASRGARR